MEINDNRLSRLQRELGDWQDRREQGEAFKQSEINKLNRYVGVAMKYRDRFDKQVAIAFAYIKSVLDSAGER